MNIVWSVVLFVLLLAQPSLASQTASLTWDPVAGATSYKVYRGTLPCTDLGPLQPLPGQPVITLPAFVDSTIADGVADVCYEVTASNTAGESLRSTRAGKTFAVGSVTYSLSSIALSAEAGSPGAQVALVTATNHMNVSVTATWSDAMTGLSNSVPAGAVTIAPNAIQAYTIRYTPSTIVGTSTGSGTMTIVPVGGKSIVTTFPITLTATPKPTVPPLPGNLKVTQIDGDKVEVAWLVKDCTSVSNVRSGPSTNKVITITCLH